MGVRGKWGGSDNVHGNAPSYLPAFKLMAKLLDGGYTPTHFDSKVIQSKPEWFDGDRLTPEGVEVIEKVRRQLPCIWSAKTFKATK